MKKLFIGILALITLLLPLSCGSSNADSLSAGEPISMHHARLLTLDSLDRGLVMATIKNPWDTTRIFAKYLLADSTATIPANLAADVNLIRTPIKRTFVYSELHIALLDELGCLESVKGTIDTNYIISDSLKNLIRRGEIADCGTIAAVNIEKVISLRPDIIIISPYENSGDEAKYSRTGITLLEAADYMESTPLGRAEWIRLYSRLFGKGALGDSIFSDIEQRYLQLTTLGKKATSRPSVIFDLMYSGIWNVPTSGSVTGRIIEDAGGSNPFGSYSKGGSAQLSGEEVLMKGGDADIWLIRHAETSPISLAQVSALSPIYSHFKAMQRKRVYGASTLATPLFIDGAFHPEKILAEMIKIIHPEINQQDSTLNYYYRIY